MRLYKIELFKLCCRKAFLINCVVAVGILLLYFWFVEVGGERSTVDGNDYQGYEAVQKNRQITEEYKGELTDNKIESIIERYGFPKKVLRDYPGFVDSNYLNAFVTDYLSDGYMSDWDNYQIPSKVLPVGDTYLGKYELLTGNKIELYYAKGWTVFLEVLQMGMVLGSILVIFGISIVFSNESQTKMLQLIFTTEEGKRKNVSAKNCAAFTLAAGVYLAVVILDLILCIMVYGMDGMEMPYGIISGNLYFTSYLSAGEMSLIALLLSLLALLVLCGVTMCISALSKSTFLAVATASVFWGLPILLRIFFGGFMSGIMSGTPIFLIMTGNILDIYLIWFIPVTFAVLLMTVSVIVGHKVYQRMQAV